MMNNSLDEDLINKVEWVDVSSENTLVSPWDRMKIKITRNPFVPIGVLCTVTVLGMGLNSFRHGNKHRSQMLMRWRVGLQGFTIVCAVCGMFLEKMT